MAQIENDSFEYQNRHRTTFIKSTMKSGGLKKSYQMAKETREIMFGINHKRDNQKKTKQLTIWQ